MPDLWRLYRAQLGPGLDGVGGTFAPGRWHKQGELAVYFGATAAIAVLEKLAHTDADLLPGDLRLGLFHFPAPIAAALAEPLPENWTNLQPWSQQIGTEWLRARSACLLPVPSAILPEESNYLFNPRHPDAQSIVLVRERPFAFDPRLL